MKIASVKIVGVAPYSQSRPTLTKKDRNETHDAHEKRTWRERMHVNDDGYVFIPPMAFKNCIAEAAKYKSVKIPGKGTSTYTKHFVSGILCIDPLVLDVKGADCEGETVFVPSDGKRGGGKRVWKTFPLIRKWAGNVQFIIVDDLIDEEVFTTHLIDAGQFIGLGRFRPMNNGHYGRFKVEKIEFEAR